MSEAPGPGGRAAMPEVLPIFPLTGAVLGAVLVNYGKTYFTSGFLAPYWLFLLGGLFVAVTLLLPRGIVGTIHHWSGQWRERRAAAGAAPEAVRAPDAAARPAE